MALIALFLKKEDHYILEEFIVYHRNVLELAIPAAKLT